jgi:hypothetical protein
MKNGFYIIFFFLFFANILTAQNKYDNKWISGGYPVLIDFSNNMVVSSKYDSSNLIIYAEASSSICDTSGSEIIIGTTGGDIYNKLGTVIQDGDTISPKLIYNHYFGFPAFFQGSLILPSLNNKYYVFTYSVSDTNFQTWQNGGSFFIDNLFYNLIDMNANNGLGKVTKKMRVAAHIDSMSQSRMTAVKHANGRDWWVVKNKFKQQQMITVLAQPDTVLGPYIQSFPNILDTGWQTIPGQAQFSKSGNLFMNLSPFGPIAIYNFDRCSGQFTFLKQLYLPRDTAYDFYPRGACFSPNDSLLYICSYYDIFQYNIYETDSSLALVHIAGPDALANYFQGFSQIIAAPNGTLWLDNWGKVQNKFSIINNPNNVGLACNYAGRSFAVPNINAGCLPNVVNYNLGALIGSACDTLLPEGINSVTTIAKNLKIYPNPANSVLNIESKFVKNESIKIYNSFGQLVHSQTATTNEIQKINIEHLPQGLYCVVTESARAKFSKE